MTFRREQQLEHFPHHGIVLDDHDRAQGRGYNLSGLTVTGRPCSGLDPGGRHFDGKNRTLSRTGTNIDRVAEPIADALHDRATEAKAEAALAAGIIDLVKFFEDSFDVFRRDAHAG